MPQRYTPAFFLIRNIFNGVQMPRQSQVLLFSTDDELRNADLFAPTAQSLSQHSALLSRQRLLRLDMPGWMAEAFCACDVTSAFQIAEMSEYDFVTKHGATCGSDIVAKRIHQRATSVRAQTIHHYLALKTATTAHYRAGLFADMVDQAHASAGTIPGYDVLFGSQDYLAVPEARSVLSPAAYFVDLLRLKEKFIDDSTAARLDDRRPELKRIRLDAPNTETLLPQPALATYLLENYLMSQPPSEQPLDVADIERSTLWNPSEAVYGRLSHQLFPPQLPFDATFDSSTLLHSRLGVSRGRLYSAFKDQPLTWVEAREALNINDARWKMLINSRDDTALYGVPDVASASVVTAFMAGTGLTPAQLHTFLYLDLDQAGIARGEAASFYLNQNGSGYYLAISGDAGKLAQQKLVRRKQGVPDVDVDVNTLDRAARFARLAADLDWPFDELDWALRSSCSGRIDIPALLQLAKIGDWRRRWKMPMAELCALWSELRPSLFDRTFNTASVAFPVNTEWKIDGSEVSENIVARLCQGIGATREELFFCVDWISPRPTSGAWTLQLTHSNVAKLYRLVHVPRRLDFTVFNLRVFLNSSLDSVQDFDGVFKKASRLSAFGLHSADLASFPLTSNAGVKLKAFSDSDIFSIYNAVRTQKDNPDRILAQELLTLSDTPAWLGAIVLAKIAAHRKVSLATDALIADMNGQSSVTDASRSFFDLIARCVTLAALLELDEPQAKLFLRPLNLGNFNIADFLDLLDYRRLKRDFKDVGNDFLAYLDEVAVSDAVALAAVARVTGWDIEELRRLCQNDSCKFRDGWSRNVSGLLRLTEAMEVKVQTGMDITQLRAAANAIDTGGAALFVAAALRAKMGAAWPKLQLELEGILIARRRDALVAAAMVKSGARDSRALYESLLIDIETSGEVKTSLLISATSAVQLYIQRFLLGLEEKANCKGGSVARAQLELEWQWMKSYRLWEANRQVFLFPEDYAFPDARKNKSEQFAALEDALGQTDVGASDVDQAFRGYADDFSEVASLRTAGACVYFTKTAAGSTATLVLIGATRKQPYKHYSRFVTFSLNSTTQQYGQPVWRPWTEIDIAIKTRDVTPVYAFGRIFLVWVETVQSDSTDMSGTEKGAKLTEVTLTRKSEVLVSIFCSSHDLTGRWEQPQSLGKVQNVDAKAWSAITSHRPVQAYAAPQDVPTPFHEGDADVDAVVVLWNPTPDKTKDDQGGIASYALAFREDMSVTELNDLPSPPSQNQHLELVDSSTLSVIPHDHFKRNYALNRLSFSSNTFNDSASGCALRLMGDVPSWVSDYASKFSSMTSLEFSNVLRVDEAGAISFRISCSNKDTGMTWGPFRRSDKDISFDWYLSLEHTRLSFYEAKVIGGKVSSVTMTQSDTRLRMDSVWQHVVVGYRPGKGPSSFVVYVDGQPKTFDCSSTTTGFESLPEKSVLKVNGVSLSAVRFMSINLPDDVLVAEATEKLASAAVVFSAVTDAKLKVAGNRRDWGVLGTGEEELLVKTTVDADGRLAAEYWRMNSSVVDKLARRLRSGGVDNLLSLPSQETKEISFQRYKPQESALARSPQESIDWSGPNGQYFWELFLHAPRLIAQLLTARQKFPEAKAMLDHVFDPTKDSCWRFLGISGKAGSIEEALQNPGALAIYHDDPFDPHAVAALRPVAYQKTVVMDYVGILIEWADSLFRAYTSETVCEAELLYTLAYDLLGRRPANLGPVPLPPAVAYRDLKNIQDFLVKLENSSAALWRAPCAVTPTPNDSVPSLYFGIPENDAFIALFDRVDDRLLKIRMGLSIDGARRALPLFAPLADSFDLVRSAASHGGSEPPFEQREVPNYRFLVLLERAKGCVAGVCELGSSLLYALEKKDAAQLERLFTMHEADVLGLTLEMKRLQALGALGSIDELVLAQRNAAMRRDRYGALLSGGMLSQEICELDALNETRDLTGKAGIAHTVASALRLLPQVGSPMAMVYGGVQTGAAAEATGQVFNFRAAQRQLDSQMNAAQAGFLRRTEEWALARDTADFEAQQLATQIDAARIFADAAARDYGLTCRQMTQAAQRDGFLRGRFTSQELYQWTSTRLGVLYRDAYQSALALAGQCEAALQFELGVNERYVSSPYWDDLRRGLLAGETLRGALNRMERAYLDGNTRRLEIQKTFVFAKPTDLIGSVWKIAITAKELGFDRHYMRQIQSVHVTFPALIGPYQEVRVALHQTSSQLQSQNGDLRDAKRAGQKVILSRGVNDNGMLVLENDGRYEPFEGTGAISTWELEFFDTSFLVGVSEIVFVLNYTALSA
jgi:hypothetical protein